MKKRICMVVPSFSAKGGITSVVSGYKKSKLENDYDIRYIETYCDDSKISKFLIILKAYFKFLYLLFFWKPDIVHIHSSFGGSFYRKLPFIFLAYKTNIKIINHIHGADFNDFYLSASSWKKSLIKKTYGKCSVIIALSNEWKDKLKQIVNEEKIVVIENYGILEKNAIKERQYKVNNHNILFLGFICKRKGCYDIPKIVERVANEFPDVKFILAGSGDIDKIKAITPEKIKRNIFYPGWVRNEEKDKLLRNADLFFLPSYNEGMPMSILDAMGYGLPIVSTNVGGIKKIVHENENGFTCDPGDVMKLSEKILKLLMDDQLLKTAGNESVLIIKKYYSLETHIKKLELVYGA